MPTPIAGNEKLAFDHDGVDTASYYTVVDNGTPALFVPTAVEGIPNRWKTPFPAMTPGDHDIKVKACNVAGCSESDVLAIRVVVIPQQPSGLGILPE